MLIEFILKKIESTLILIEIKITKISELLF